MVDILGSILIYYSYWVSSWNFISMDPIVFLNQSKSESNLNLNVIFDQDACFSAFFIIQLKIE